MKAIPFETDVLIIGGGAAGCSAALQAHRMGARVQMVVKGKTGRSGATPLASGIAGGPSFGLPYPVLAVVAKIYAFLSNFVRIPAPASYTKHLRGAVDGHYGLGDQDYFLRVGLYLVGRFFPRLEHNNFTVLRDQNGEPVHPGGGAVTFVSHSHGMTGYQFGEARRKEVLKARIPVMEETTAFELLTNERGEVAGALAFNYRTGELFSIKAGATILATGHTNWMAKRTTGTREMAANGLAMAVRAGAELENLEIQWFHAGDMGVPESWMRLHHYPNPMHGSVHRGVMKNSAGETYMRVEEFTTRTPYPIQMKKLYEQVKAGKADWDKGFYFNFSPVERDHLKNYQYHWEFYEKLGKDMATDDLECGVTWHMTAGGVRNDGKSMKTGVPRLYVAGAAGAHMLGGLPLATFDGETSASSAVAFVRRKGMPADWDETLVHRAEQRLSDLLATASEQPDDTALSPIAMKSRIREVVSNNMMYVRTDSGLKNCLSELSAIRADLPRLRLRRGTAKFNMDVVDALDIEDMLDVSEMAAHASLLRQESRGPYFREDFPYTDNENWLKKIVVRREKGEVKSRLVPVNQKFVRYKPERIDFLKEPYT